jgi:WhiB family transcriptional regulator, redox-sensing transcriptional regulator
VASVAQQDGYHAKKEWTIMDWRHDAACREVDPELFFPIGNSGPALLQIEEAKQVCHRCPVTEDCLTWAIDTGQDAGVWGGLSEDERRAYKRRALRLRARAHAASA